MPCAPRSLADVIAALSDLPDLTPRTHLDLASAVRTVCKVMGLDPAATDAGDLAGIQARLAAARPERTGLSRGRWSVLRSQFLGALARLERAIPKAGRRPILLISQRIVDASLERLDQTEAEYASRVATASRKHLQNLALRYRDALLVTLASLVPIRRSNLAELLIGSTICRGPEVWSIHIPGEQVKNRETVDADLPGWISERVDRFVEVYRPLVYRSSRNPGLWASAKGCPATGEALYTAFQKEIANSLSVHLTLHDTRRIAATTWAVHDPVNAAGAKDLLGDRSDRVFVQHYNLASGIEASRAMAGLVARLKTKDA